MAEMEVKGGKHSTRVDLTPMVDLGFLLITFFMFTTTMASPTAMDLVIPQDAKDEDEQTKIKESGAFTILIGKNNSVFYYEGQLKDKKQVQKSSFANIRTAIINKKQNTDTSNFVVVIKPSADATYLDAVNILDEMVINEVKRYALVDPAKQESDLMTELLSQPNNTNQ